MRATFSPQIASFPPLPEPRNYFFLKKSTFFQKPIDFFKIKCYNIKALCDLHRQRCVFLRKPPATQQVFNAIKSGCGAVGSALPWGGRGRKFKSCHSDQKGDSSESPFFFVFRPKSRVFSHFSVALHPNASAKSNHIEPQKSGLTTCLTHSLTTW